MRKFFFMLIISLFSFTACTTGAEPTETLTLEQNYSVQLANGTVSIDYPADWIASSEFADFGVRIATSQELATNTAFDGTVGEGEVYIEILYSLESALDVDTPSAVLQAIVDSISNLEGTVSEIEERSLNDKVAAIITLDSDDSSDGMFIVIDSGDAYSTIVIAFADGALSANQATVEAIAGSIEYTLTASDG